MAGTWANKDQPCVPNLNFLAPANIELSVLRTIKDDEETTLAKAVTYAAHRNEQSFALVNIVE